MTAHVGLASAPTLATPEGEIDPEDLAHISPYPSEHINWFGEYRTHEFGIQAEAFDPKVVVGFTLLREQGPDRSPASDSPPEPRGRSGGVLPGGPGL
ncbi:hypothetical protein [Streptomyces sp. NPDC002588]|uniref:hypothetical protein n=1 Tax=Streptomyces sp. NPDC002588 TaxID=3154419 RepID=UPI00332E1243